MKEFPDHEKEKTLNKQKEKEKRAEEKRRKRQEDETEKKKKQAARNLAQKEEDEIPKFLPQENESSTAMDINQTIQYGAVAVVGVALVSYLLM